MLLHIRLYVAIGVLCWGNSSRPRPSGSPGRARAGGSRPAAAGTRRRAPPSRTCLGGDQRDFGQRDCAESRDATQTVCSYPCLETDTNASTPAYDHSGPAWSYWPFAKRPFHPLRMPHSLRACTASRAASSASATMRASQSWPPKASIVNVNCCLFVMYRCVLF